MRSVKAGLIALVVSLLPLPLAAQTGDVSTQLRAIVEDERGRSSTPAISAALLVDGIVVAEVASGLADREAGIHATPETIFGAASVSKLFTATLVMRQIERGKLALDEPANRWLDPGRQIRDADGDPIGATIRQLLTHTSGLPISWAGLAEEMPELSEFLVQGLVVARKPGEKIVYANDGYALLGYLAAQAEGEEFSEHARRVLFEPLGMTSSSFRRHADLAPRIAAGYGTVIGGDGRAAAQFTSVASPAGSLFSTPRDLLRFARMILQRGELDGVRVLSSASVDEMLRLQARNHPQQDEGYGLGFMVRERNGRKTAWHDGDYPGVASRLEFLPERGAAVAILSNRADHGPVNQIARRALDLVVGQEETTAVPVAADVLESFVGTYRVLDTVPPEVSPLGLFFNIELRAAEGRLRASIPFMGQTMDLHPLAANRFRILGGMADDATVVFDQDRVVVSFLEARRIPAWQGARVLVVYLAVGALALLAVPTFVVFRRSNRAAGIHWGRVLAGGFLAEVAIYAVAIPIFLLVGEQETVYSVPPAAFAASFLFGMWVARRSGSRFVLHGTLVGVVAVLLYVVVSWGQPQPFLYMVAHGLKILGGAAGGRVVVGAEKRPLLE